MLSDVIGPFEVSRHRAGVANNLLPLRGEPLQALAYRLDLHRAVVLTERVEI
jgi:hypothetical protein